MPRFTTRELMLIMAIVALGLGWIAERNPLITQNAYLRQQNVVLLDLAGKLRRQAEDAEAMRELSAQSTRDWIGQMQKEIKTLKGQTNSETKSN